MTTPKKVAVVGKCPTSRFRAPFDDPEYEIWSLSPTMLDGECAHDLPRWDRWFEVHPLSFVENICPGYTEWMHKSGKPIYLQEKSPLVSSSIEYPLADIQKHLGPFPYFSCSPSYMIAMAIHWGVSDLGVYGLDMATRAEYGWQRPSVEYWLGIAVGRGINLHIPAETDLLKAGRLYGFEQSDMTAKVHARKQELEHRQQLATMEHEQFQNLYMMAAGACKEIEKWRASLNGDTPAGMDDRYDTLKEQMEKCLQQARQAEKDQERVTGAQEGLEWCEQWA